MQPPDNDQQNPGGNNAPPRRPSGWLIALAIGLAVIVAGSLLLRVAPDALDGRGARVSLSYNLLWLGVLIASLVAGRRLNASKALRHAAIWIAIGAALVLAYSLRHEGAALGGRLFGALVPAQPVAEKNGISVGKSSDGHFRIVARVNGVAVRFLVDTGASEITLSPTDARRAGLLTDRLAYRVPMSTANGVVMAARVQLRDFSLGAIRMANVPAMVSQAPTDTSLLGMRFLGRLGEVKLSGDRLSLVP